MKRSSLILIIALCAACTTKVPESITISKDALKDKIMGGWAGQTIGVVYGAPTEFKFTGTLIPDNMPTRKPLSNWAWMHRPKTLQCASLMRLTTLPTPIRLDATMFARA